MDYDVLIIGCGPAGLQAAIHAARKKVRVAVIGRTENSGLARAEVENYFGIDHMSGKDLLSKGIEQAKRFGAELFEPFEKTLTMESGRTNRRPPRCQRCEHRPQAMRMKQGHDIEAAIAGREFEGRPQVLHLGATGGVRQGNDPGARRCAGRRQYERHIVRL